MSTTLLSASAVTSLSAAARPVRVCHVSVGLCTGGLERLMVDFARFHDRERTEMHFIALRDMGRPAEEIRASGCRVYAANVGSRWHCLKTLRKLFRQIRPDIVHTHNAYPHVHGSLAARWAGVPAVVHTRHGQRFGETRRANWEFWFASLFADRLVAVSEDAAELSRVQDRLPARKVRCIWNGIDTSRFAYRGPANKPVAISVARLSPEKDFPTLLRAIKLALPEVPELELRIVGGGGERIPLETLARDLGLGTHVQFLGERADVPELLADAGFFVSSSLTEGISLTLLEAAAVGLPIVATNVGGNPEIIVDGQTGTLVPAADAQKLASAIVELCRQPDRWTGMGQAGRDRVLQQFDIRRMIHDYEDLYAELLPRAASK